MNFTPMTEEEIQAINLIADGLYPYEVIYAEDTISKAGNDQIKLKLKIYCQDGKEGVVECYLTSSFLKILKHYCDVNNKKDKYESGNLQANECLSDSGGLVDIKIDKGKPIPNDPDGKCWPDRNVVKDFVHDKNHAKIQVNTPKEFLNDDIPF